MNEYQPENQLRVIVLLATPSDLKAPDSIPTVATNLTNTKTNLAAQ
jgi:hypothetical protein